MTKEGANAFVKLLGTFHPAWVLAILFAIIVAYRLPSIIREVFTGLREHAKVQVEIKLKQDKADREIEEKRVKMTKRTKKVPPP